MIKQMKCDNQYGRYQIDIIDQYSGESNVYDCALWISGNYNYGKDANITQGVNSNSYLSGRIAYSGRNEYCIGSLMYFPPSN